MLKLDEILGLFVTELIDSGQDVQQLRVRPRCNNLSLQPMRAGLLCGTPQVFLIEANLLNALIDIREGEVDEGRMTRRTRLFCKNLGLRLRDGKTIIHPS